MEKARLAGVLALAVVTAVTVGAEFPKTAAQRQEAAEYRALLEATPLAQVEGEALSPDGRFRVETAGRTDLYVSGLVVPEFLQVRETASWRDAVADAGPTDPERRMVPGRPVPCPGPFHPYPERIDSGGHPDLGGLGLHSARRQSHPEYAFFPEDWAVWRDKNTLR